jgi:pSer/pThr/pTyr-binding forkhead associated (FHA) protein
MQVVLVMFRADGERRSFSIVRDMTVVGRREDCDLRIPLGEVSRKHCRLIKDGEAIKVEDLGSSNGTFHNGQRVREGTLAPGDTIQIGPVTFMVQIDGVPADEDMQPASTAATAESGEAEVTAAEPAAAQDAADPAAEAAAEPAADPPAAPPTENLNLDPITQDEHSAASAELEFDFAEEPTQEQTSNDKPA